MTKRPQKETAFLWATDWHYGRSTSSYNPVIFRQRLGALSKHLARIRELMPGYEFDKLVLGIGGDLNDGTDIYPGQANYQDITDVARQAREVSHLLTDFVLHQMGVWGGVQVECVPGNHGRSGKRAHEAANWDIVAYNYLQADLKGKAKVNFNEEGDPFIRQVGIRGHKYLLYHGHDIRSFGNIPWYGMLLRLSRWSMTSKLGPFDCALMGHFHTFGSWQFNTVQMMASGSMVTDDEWALRVLGWESSPKWWLFGISDSRPVTWSFGVDLV